jgi:hypothetical protein
MKIKIELLTVSFGIYAIIMGIMFALLLSCSKSSSSNLSNTYQEGWTRVIGVKDTDTSSTKFMQARTETVGLAVAEDDKMRVSLLSYTNGTYTIEVVNKLGCPTNLKWDWTGLTIGTILPSNPILSAYGTGIYTLYGSAKVGTIKVKGFADCGNSSSLIINITPSILPIEFTNAKTQRIGDKMVVNWSTEEPNKVDWFFVLWSPDGRKEHEVVKYSIVSDHSTKNYTASFPAIKTTDK